MGNNVRPTDRQRPAGVSFPAGYDFEAEHENDIARVRAQAQVDATLERDELRVRIAGLDRRIELRRKASAGPLTDAELEEFETLLRGSA